MPLIASRHPSSCRAWACPDFNASCQSLPLCVCVSMCIHAFPLWLCSLFWHVFLMPVIICIYLFVDMFLGASASLSGDSVCVWCNFLSFFELLSVFSTALALSYKELPVFNPITFIPSTFLITTVENWLRWINLLCFWCQRSEFLQGSDRDLLRACSCIFNKNCHTCSGGK